jgi:hypothetical protein
MQKRSLFALWTAVVGVNSSPWESQCLYLRLVASHLSLCISPTNYVSASPMHQLLGYGPNDVTCSLLWTLLKMESKSLVSVGFKVLTVVTMRSMIFWVVMVCSLVEVHWCFREMCHLHLWGWGESQVRVVTCFLLGYSLAYSSTIKMETIHCCKMSIHFNWTIWHSISIQKIIIFSPSLNFCPSQFYLYDLFNVNDLFTQMQVELVVGLFLLICYKWCYKWFLLPYIIIIAFNFCVPHSSIILTSMSTKQVIPVVMLACGRCLVPIFVRTLAIPTEISLWFSQLLQANSVIVPWLRHGRFFRNPLQFISHPVIWHFI